MPISSGRGVMRIPKMQHPKEFFDIGEPFWYSPLSDKSIEMLLVPMECKDVEDEIEWSIHACKRHCALFELCTSRKNIEENTDPISGETFIPACSILTRNDHANAYFKEYQK